MATQDPSSHSTTGYGTGSSSGSGMNAVKEQAQDVVDQAQSKAGQVADQARSQAVSQVESRKGQAADSIGSVADAARGLGQQLRENDQGTMAHYVDQLADSIDGFSTYLRHTDLADIVEDAQDFARRQPALFLGGAFLVGVVAARFLKSSSPERGPMDGGARGMGGGSRGSFSGQYRSGYDRPSSYRAGSFSRDFSGAGTASGPSTPPMRSFEHGTGYPTQAGSTVGNAPHASGMSTTPYTTGTGMGGYRPVSPASPGGTTAGTTSTGGTTGSTSSSAPSTTSSEQPAGAQVGSATNPSSTTSSLPTTAGDRGER